MTDVLPPMLPRATPPASRKGFPAWAIALLCGGALWAIVVTVLVTNLPFRHESSPRLACLNNLSQLGQIWMIRAQERPDEAGKYSGSRSGSRTARAARRSGAATRSR